GKPAEELLIKGKGGIKFALGENPKRKGQSRHSSYPDGRMGIAHIIRKSFIEAQEYMKKWEDYRQKKADGKIVMPPRKDLRLEATADVLRGKLKIHCHCYRADEIEMILNLCEEFGVKILSLEHCLEGYRVADEIVKHGAIPSIFIDFWGYKMEAFDASPYNVKLLYEKGAKVSINSDSNERIRRLYHEAAKAVKYGVPEEEALKMITLHSAEILDIADRIGSLEIGKDGDIAIFSGHPFSVYSKCVKTIIEGEIYFDRNTVKTTEKILKLSGTIPADSKKGDAR
ncbi:MAG: amidohydrolase family protein, partial [Candidatus Heimdallarchaeota archaeon]|nr:amidohydrolase family protein [Candidatus Heimdallarchaeota archaeon]